MAELKRFYKAAGVGEAEGGFTVTLDGRPIRTPAGTLLIMPTTALAEAVAAEWEAQEELIAAHTMPLTQLASTALDRVAPQRQPVIDELVKYGGADLLCYRAETPADLARRQELMWQPILDWASAHLGVELLCATGIQHVQQPEPALTALRQVIERYDDYRLTALQSAVAAKGSLLLGIALIEGRISAEEGFALSQLDETYQIELWGEDYEVTLRRETLRKDISSATRFIELCFPGLKSMPS